MRQYRIPAYIVDNHGKPWSSAFDAVSDALGGTESYKSGSFTRRQGSAWAASGGSADSDYLPHQRTIRARSRDASRNNPLGGGALLVLDVNVIGTGLKLRPQINNRILGLSREEVKFFTRALQSRFALATAGVEFDIKRTSTWGELQQLGFRAAMESGDALIMTPTLKRIGSPFSTKVQIVEGDRVTNPGHNLFNTPQLISGVEMDRHGAPTAYWVEQSHPGSLNLGINVPLPRGHKRFEAFGRQTGRRLAWLLARRQRPDQTRGIPYLANILEDLKQIDRYKDAELQAAVVSGLFTVFVKTENGEDLMPAIGMPLTSLDEGEIGESDTDYVLDAGSVVTLRKNQSIETADPKRPNPNFDMFVTPIIKMIGAGLGIPYEFLIKNFTASFSASRAAALEASKFFNVQRAWFALNFCQPIYETIITEDVITGRLNLPGFLENDELRQAWLCGDNAASQWIGPTPGQVRPTDEVSAARERIELGISTKAKETAEITGMDWEEVNEQRAEEIEIETQSGTLNVDSSQSGLRTTNIDTDDVDED